MNGVELRMDPPGFAPGPSGFQPGALLIELGIRGWCPARVAAAAAPGPFVIGCRQPAPSRALEPRIAGHVFDIEPAGFAPATSRPPDERATRLRHDSLF